MPDYTFYVEDYLGEDIPEKEFPRFIRRAGDELRRMREMYAVAPRQGLDPELAESMALCAVAAVTLFAVPFRGSLWALLLLSSVFMLSALGQGLFISVSLRGQLVAAEAGLFSGFLPALLLSGFVFDINSMPPILQAITRLLPASYFNTCLRTIFLTGDVWSIFGPSLLFMGLLAAVLLGLVYKNLVKRLDV